MSRIKNVLLSLLLFSICTTKAQDDIYITVDSLSDRVYDASGHQYLLANLNVAAAKLGTATINATITCQAGYFTLHFDPNSLAFASQAARDVACQVYSNLSNLINSSLAPGSIHILFKDGYSTLATASPIYAFPWNASGLNFNQGIIRSQVELALLSGVAPFTGVPFSFNMGTSFYSGIVTAMPPMQSTTVSTISWNYSLTTTNIPSGEYDFYTNLLHEAYHLLGFMSLIKENGNSAFTSAINPWNNYYSQFDLFLYDHTGQPLIVAQNAGCPTSSLTFGPSSTSVITAAQQTSTVFQNSVNCAVSVQYSSALVGTVAVHTPSFFNGSSLKHFEDMCTNSYTGSCSSPPGANDLYFVTSNFAGQGPCYVKRHPTEEEKKVLCDLGYSTNGVYGSTLVAGSMMSYTSGACSPTNVIGLNDGLTGGVYTYTTTSASIVITNSTQVLNNDSPPGTLSVSCLEAITNATVSTGLTDFTVQATQGSGLHIIKYYPKDANGNVGNATYVFVYFVNPNCLPGSNCGNMVSNGGFESSQPAGACGQFSVSNNINVDCWEGYNASSPFIFYPELALTSCGTTTKALSYNLSSMPISTLNVGSANNQCLGLGHGSNASSVVRNALNSPLQNGQGYQLTFWAINLSTFPPLNLNLTNQPAVISLASSPHAATTATPGYPNGLDLIANFTVSPGTLWTQFTYTFTYSPTANGNFLFLGVNAALTPSNTGTTWNHCYIDDVRLVALPTPSLSLPKKLCVGDGVTDLAAYASVTGTFSGSGVTTNTSTGKVDFNVPGNLPAGVYPIAFTYSTQNCLETVYHGIWLSNCCDSSSVPGFGGTSVSGSSVFAGPFRLLNSFTVQSGGSLFLNGEIMITPSVQITIENNAQVLVTGAHLYACTDMWEGFEVLDGGKIVAQEYQGVTNMIEDAETAIKVLNNTSTSPVLDITNTVFNRNHIDIDLGNWPNADGGSINIHSNVFSSRVFTFTGTSWPQAGLADLRSAAGGTNVMHGPYELRNTPPGTLKKPRTGEYPETAIRIMTVGTTSGTYPNYTYDGVQVGYTLQTNPEDRFNLFDCHEAFIQSVNSNLALRNNVFQNAFSAPGTRPAVDFSCTTADKILDMGATQVNLSNRFFDFYYGVRAINAADFIVENAVFRSSMGVGTSTVIGSQPIGKAAITGVSSVIRDYRINNNEFNNIHFSIGLGTANGTVHSVAINSNTFSPTIGITNTFALTNLLNSPIVVSSPFQVHSPTGSSGITINDNIIFRAYNGIIVNGFGLQGASGACGAPLTIDNNSILLEEMSFTPLQRGICITNNTPVYTGSGCPWPSVGSAGYRSVTSNTVDMFFGNLSTSKISLFHTFNSAGPSIPPLFMTCNAASDAHEGFSFEGYQPGVYWRGNKMDNLARGMILKNGGVIGQQGTQTGTASDNEWLGSSWTSTNHGIYTSASQATNSPIIRRTSPSQFDPPNLSGNPFSDSYFWGGLMTYTGSSSFSCGVTYTQMPSITVPNEGDYESDDILYIAQTAVYRQLHINSDLRTSHAAYDDFHSLFEGTAMETLADIELAFIAEDVDGAVDLLSGLIPDDLQYVEGNYFQFYTIFLAYKQNAELDASDIADLAGLCALCPGIDGACVLQARALYQLVTGELFEGEDCAGGEGQRKANKRLEKEEVGQGKLKVLIVPNPSSEFVFIRLNKKTDGLIVQVSDVSGRHILTRKLAGEAYAFRLSYELAPGVYFCQISTGGENVTEKIIVAR